MAAQQSNVNAWFAANPNATPDQIYSAAQQYGVSGAQIDAARGAWSGASDAWVASKGLQALPGSGGGGGGGGGGMLSNTNPAVGTVVGSNGSGLDMNDAYYKIFQSQVGKSGSNESFSAWKTRPIGAEYQPSLNKMNSLGNAYYGQRYESKDEEQAAWNDMVDQSGLSEGDFNNLYGQYMDRAPVRPKVDLPLAAQTQYTPEFKSAVDAPTETIEGRIKNLLDANNPVIRQAGDRALAQFAGRGLLNSSMATEAANEAMISKAIEIAGPDAQRYFQNRRENVDWQNRFAQNAQLHGYDLEKMDHQFGLNQQSSNSAHVKALQTNYLTAVQNAESQMQRFIQTIQSSNIPPEAKTEQIREVQTSFNNTISMMKAAYKLMPQWSDEWALFPAELV